MGDETTEKGFNPMSTSIRSAEPSAPVMYAVVSPTIVIDDAQSYPISNSRTSLMPGLPNLNPWPDRETEEHMTLQGKIGQQHGKNLVILNNTNLRRGGDANIPLNPEFGDDWKHSKELTDQAIAEVRYVAPLEPQFLPPELSESGPSPLDHVKVVSTNYAIPASHGVGEEEYQFGASASPPLPEYKSMYER